MSLLAPLRAQLRTALRHRDEDGLSLIEVIVALLILAIILVMTVGPTLTSYDTLRRARAIDAAESIGESRIETARQLPFADLDLTTAGGAVLPLETVEINGLAMEVTTEIDWVGSSGDKDPGFFIGGHDGVEGVRDLGYNYKWVVVTVTPIDSEAPPVVFNTAIAPPSLASGDATTGTVVVNVRAHEPVGGATAPASMPQPVLVPAVGAAITPTQNLNDGTFVFENVPESNPLNPYYVRLGSDLADIENDGIPTRWRIHQSDLISATDEVTVNGGEVNEVTITVYQPVSLTIFVEGPAAPGAANVDLALGSLVIGYEGRFQVFTQDHMTGGGTWTIDEFNEAPLVPGTYSVQVDAPGYVPWVDHNVVMTESYPIAISKTIDIELSAAAANTVERTYFIVDEAGNPMRGVVGQIVGGAVAANQYGPLVVVSNENGFIRANLPVNVTPTLSLHPPYGHQPQSHSPGAATIPGTETIVLATPAGHALLTLTGGNDGYFTYLAPGSGTSWSVPVLTNASGEASIAVPIGGTPQTWGIRKICWGAEDTPTSINHTVTGDATIDMSSPAC